MTVTRIATTTPVSILVDTLTGEVLKVIVDDETAMDYECIIYDDGEQVTPHDRAATLAAVKCSEWPAWQFGWCS